MQHPSDAQTESTLAGENKLHMVLKDRIREKISDYAYYKFTARQTRALNIFFDLAQEYEDLEYLYHLPVQVLQFFFHLKAELYARDETGTFTAQAPNGSPPPPLPPLEELCLGPLSLPPSPSDSPDTPTWCFFPVKGRPDAPLAASESKSATHHVYPVKQEDRELLAVLAIFPQTPLTEHEKLFYEKFANRLGVCLHNRMLALKNLEHIDFVRTLVHDIGHNVIVPNLHFKLLIRQMTDKISALCALSHAIPCAKEEELAPLHTLCDLIKEHSEELSKNFHQSSFFLETLLRQSHFDQGRYVLQRTTFNLVTRIVMPQFERHSLRLQEREIAVAEDYGQNADRFIVNGDMGLLSQVLANMLSNAVKYTRQTPGKAGLLVRCSAYAVSDGFGVGHDGVRVEVLSSGEPIPEDEAARLFTQNFRASNTGSEGGTGHGLYFSNLIITQHGGECGYTHNSEGNIFYLMLPLRHPEQGGPEGA